MAKKDKRKRESAALMSRRGKRKRSSRDWAALPEGIIDCIADMVLAEDVTEYIHLRGVCAAWRRATSNPAITNPRFRPRNWILVSKTADMIRMFAAASSTTQGRRPRKLPNCRFLNLSTGYLIRAHVPELSSLASGNPRFQFLRVADGLLALFNRVSGVLHLLNPFTGALLRLPPLPPYCCLDLTSVNFAASSSSTIVVSGGFLLAHAKPGDVKWSFSSATPFSWILSFQDQVYSLSPGGRLLHLELDQNRFTSLDLSLPKPTGSRCDFYPVASDEEMLVVCFYRELRLLQVFQIDLESRTLIPKNSLGDRALFFSSLRKAFLVSTSIIPSLKPNSIYFCPSGERTLVFHPFDCRCHPQKKNLLRKAGMYHEIPETIVESLCWAQVDTISSYHEVYPSGYVSLLNLSCKMY